MELDSGPLLNGLTLLDSSTVIGQSCNASLSKISPSELIISKLLIGCIAEVQLETIVSEVYRHILHGLIQDL